MIIDCILKIFMLVLFNEIKKIVYNALLCIRHIFCGNEVNKLYESNKNKQRAIFVKS